MEKEEEELKPIMFEEPMLNFTNTYEVISTTYYEEYAKCSVLVFNNQTGEIKLNKFDLK